jgi:hypothetical protein
MIAATSCLTAELRRLSEAGVLPRGRRHLKGRHSQFEPLARIAPSTLQPHLIFTLI